MALIFTSPENLEKLKQELIDLTFEGVLTTDAGDLVTGTLAPDRIGNDSLVETKLHPDIRTKLNTVGSGESYTHPNHTGEVTSTGDGATVIANGVVTEAKLSESVNTSLDLADTASQPGHPHTVSNITDFDTAVSANADVMANTAKVTNATHTGDVTGSTVLTIPVDSILETKLHPDVRAKLNEGGGTGSDTALILIQSIGDIPTVDREGRTLLLIKDPDRGGIFIFSSESLTANNGTIFTANGGGFWVRRYEEHIGVNVKWFGAIGNYDSGTGTGADDTDAFEACFAYCLDYFVFAGGTPQAPFIRRKCVIPNGDYKITRQLKIGGRPISETDSLAHYQYIYDEAPSLDIPERQKTANTIPFSIIGDQKTSLHFVPATALTELTAMLVIGCAAYQTGFNKIETVEVKNITFVGSVGMGNGSVITNTLEQGLQVFGMWHVNFHNLNYINLQVCEQYNASYFSNRSYGRYQNCGLGFTNVGSHAQTGGSLLADHCALGYQFVGGACVWNQINTEQCHSAVHVYGGFVTINGAYLEQLDFTSGLQYQVDVFDSPGFALNGATINTTNDRFIHTGMGVTHISVCDSNLGGGDVVMDDPSGTCYIKNSSVWSVVGGTRIGPLHDGFSIDSATVNNFTSDQVDVDTLNAGIVNASGDTTHAIGPGSYGAANVERMVYLNGSVDDLLILGKITTTDTGDVVSGRLSILGNANPAFARGGYVDINFANKDLSSYSLSAVINVKTANAQIDLVTFTYSGDSWAGLRFTGDTTAWNHARFSFRGMVGGSTEVLSSIPTSSATGVTSTSGVNSRIDIRAEEVYINNRTDESQLVSTTSPIKFDLDYQIGSPDNPVSTNITFDLTGATMGSATSVFHQSASAPTFGTNIKKALINFTLTDYGNNELNEFVFHYMEDPNNANEPYLKIYHTKNITIINAI